MDNAGIRARGLLAKAEEDLYAAQCLAGDSKASLWTVGFHAQQSVEKALKAVLMGRGIRYPFTHDIAALVKILSSTGLPFPPNHDDLPYLTPFGTLFRYEDESWGEPESMDLLRLLKWAKETICWAKTMFDGDIA
ncbi:MAG: HEPN domain-containing protein [Candidatus Hydrogenedentes bacterium]|nr:HEPN domain-containing protein [Candidatus Hydrogenedentota bacterium]